MTFLPLYGYPAAQGGATASFDAGEGMMDIGGGAWDVPIPLPTGRTFTSVAGAAYDWTGATISVQLLSTQRGQLGSATTAGSRSGAAPYTLTLSCAPCSYFAGEDLFLRFTPSDAATSVTHRIDPITVTMAAVVIEGGGPHMGNLPISRTITINNGDPVPPNLLNEIQDVIISEHASRVATRTRSALIGLTGPAGSLPIDISLPFGGYQVQLAVTVGETIVGARAIIRDSATGPTKFYLTLAHNDPTVSTLPVSDATGNPSAGTGALQTISLTPYATGGNVTVVAGRTYYLYLTCSTGSTSGHLYELEYDVIPAT